MRPISFAVFIFGMALVGYTQSPPPPAPVQPKQASSNQQQPAIFERGTDKAPLVVEVNDSPAKQAESAKAEAREDAQLEINVWVMWFTGALTFFTLVQIWLFFIARKDSDKLHQSERRAFVSIWFTELSKITEGKTVEFKFVCRNHGATPARDFEFRANRWRFKGDIPKDYKPVPIDGKWNDKRGNIFPHTSFEDAARMEMGCDLGEPALTSEEADAFNERRDAWVIGLEIRYWDIFTTTYRYTREYYRIVTGERGEIKASILPGTCFVS